MLRSLIFEDLDSLELDFRILVRPVCLFCFRCHLGFSDSHVHCTLSTVKSSESFYHRLPPRISRKCMCGGDDHLAWKRLVYSKTCRSLCTIRGYDRSC